MFVAPPQAPPLPPPRPYADLSATHGHHTVGGALHDEDPLAPGLGRGVDLEADLRNKRFRFKFELNMNATLT